MRKTKQPGSGYWSTGTDLNKRELIDPHKITKLFKVVSKRLYGNTFKYNKMEFRSFDIPVTLIVQKTKEEISITPFDHFLSEDGYGNNV